MQLNITNLTRAGVVCLLLTSVAAAGQLSLETDVTTGLPGWHSTVNPLTNPGVDWNGNKILARIDYAVYAPGKFDQSVALGNPGDPSFDADYVYAYEISGSSAPVVSLTISTAPGAIPLSYVGTNHVDNWTANLGQAPNISAFIGSVSNAKWTFTTQLPATTGFSNILFFTSPFGPRFNNAALSGGGTLINTTSLPSPMVPEPTTLTIAAIAAAFLLAAGRLRRRAA